MKLIVEDADIVEKINQHLSAQIRVFSVERTNAGFSAYHFCNSRIYEYLIPTHCFLPPHTDSYLGRKLDQLAQEADDTEAYRERQCEVSSFWAEAEEAHIKPILDQLDPSIKLIVQKALYEMNLKEAEEEFALVKEDQKVEKEGSPLETRIDSGVGLDRLPSDEAKTTEPIQTFSDTTKPSPSSGTVAEQALPDSEAGDRDVPKTDDATIDPKTKEPSPLEISIRQLKAAYIAAKKAYRIDPQRLERVRSALSRFDGTHNFHNYTIDKGPRDPSVKRVIKSFVVAADPMIINNTEWLSLKVHGQSFMMHQIRKMISMVALIVRCGCHEGRIQDSYLPQRLNVPKAPSLGLLLERPVFDAYNEKLVGSGRAAIDFGKYEKEIEEFKQREIYERIFREEEQHGQ